jgi:crotonobetainyl-CoA:carnitine CoA-transferase CaiB-like acyl-CoA transferase
MRFLASVTDYPGLARPAPVPDLPVRLGASGGGITRRPPTIGEDTEALLGELGYDERAITDLREARVI